MTFQRVCELMAARNCYASGASVQDIAKSADKHVSTIYRWLKVTSGPGSGI